MNSSYVIVQLFTLIGTLIRFVVFKCALEIHLKLF